MLDGVSQNIGHATSTTTQTLLPSSVEELQEVVRCSSKIKAFGTEHSFNGISHSVGPRVSLQQLNQVIDIDSQSQTVTVAAGIRYAELAEYLHKCGFALKNLASLPHISVVGACATGSHGSGDTNQCLASAVSAIELIDARGELVHLAADDQRFGAAVVNLGALGIVTKLTLDIIPTFSMIQRVYERIPVPVLKDHFEAIFSSAYSVSMFTDWNQNYVNQLWIKALVTDPRHTNPCPELFGARAAVGPMHPVLGMDSINCTEQLGIEGAWYERLPHFRMGYTPSCGKELQSEYFVPRRHGVAAYEAILALGDQLHPHLMISEIRSVASDSHWMSPCYERESIAIHFTWKPELESVRSLLPSIENALDPFFARPHWGKLFCLNSEKLHPLYPKMPEFRRVAREFDPSGKFLNPFLFENVEKPLSFEGLL